nr:GNAT family N-acetyltransferase [Nannocystis pusilla]
MNIRLYTPADREACLELLRSNTPEHFSLAEEADLARFLDALPGPYFVVEDGGRIIASGGIAGERDGITATLCWGMVDASRQRAGVGSKLLIHRVETFLAERPQIRQLQTHTSQKVQGFYAKHGFRVVEVRPHGFGPDLDHVHMMRDRTSAGDPKIPELMRVASHGTRAPRRIMATGPQIGGRRTSSSLDCHDCAAGGMNTSRPHTTRRLPARGRLCRPRRMIINLSLRTCSRSAAPTGRARASACASASLAGRRCLAGARAAGRGRGLPRTPGRRRSRRGRGTADRGRRRPGPPGAPRRPGSPRRRPGAAAPACSCARGTGRERPYRRGARARAGGVGRATCRRAGTAGAPGETGRRGARTGPAQGRRRRGARRGLARGSGRPRQRRASTASPGPASAARATARSGRSRGRRSRRRAGAAWRAWRAPRCP